MTLISWLLAFSLSGFAKVSFVKCFRPRLVFGDSPYYRNQDMATLSQIFVCTAIASPEQGPGPRSRHCLTYDQHARRTVLFSGIDWTDGGVLPSDTWELQGGSWSPVEVSEHPPARLRSAMVYDRHREESVLFGGHAGGWTGWSFLN